MEEVGVRETRRPTKRPGEVMNGRHWRGGAEGRRSGEEVTEAGKNEEEEYSPCRNDGGVATGPPDSRRDLCIRHICDE